MRFLAAALAAVVFVSPITAMADEDGVKESVKKGKKVFRKCRACHEAATEKNKIGPHLVGIIGRKAASVESYTRYSGAIKARAGEGLEWTDENFLAFVTEPRKFIPGTKMIYGGLKKEDQRVNLLAYLKSLVPAAE